MARRASRLLALLLVVAGIAAAVWLVRGRLENRVSPATSSRLSGGALVSSIRAEPRSFNRYLGVPDSTLETVTFLTQSRLVRVNRETLEAEPMLAEGWTLADDNLTYTVKLRGGLKFSDGAPFSSADVVFSFRAIYDERTGQYGDTLRVGGKELEVRAVDDKTVTIRFPAPFGPGLRILDNLPIYPKHLLEQALDDATFAKAWGATTPPSKLAGMGPFMLREYQPGHRLVFDRNPHYWRKDASGNSLPYLDRITLEIVPDQNAELLRLESGQIDCIQSEVRPEDYAMLKQAQAAGRVRLYDLGAGLDADSFWINLRPDVKIAEPRRSWLQSTELRRAIAEAIDRRHFSDVVFFGAAVPVFGPVTPANRAWFDPKVPTPPFDPKSAASRLAAIGLKTKDRDGVLLDRSGGQARFTLITQKGNTALERGASVIRDNLRAVGLLVDVVPLEVGALIDRLERGDFEALYFRFLTTDLDPALNLDFWLSSGSAHVWNRLQPQPATAWERQVDELMTRQVSTLDAAERRRLFSEVQRVFADQVPILYFAAPRVYVATSSRVLNASPVLLRPMVLWNAERLAIKR